MIGYRIRLHQFMAERLAHKRAWRASRVPMISFTFDDFPRSALTVGGRMLTEHSCRGTYYGAMGLMGKAVSPETMFTRADLDDLLKGGHELACHTFDHTSCLAVSTGKFVDECANNRHKAATMLSGYQLQNFSFPHGHVTLAGKRSLRSVYDTCRSVEGGINSDPVDLAFLRANPIYSRLAIGTLKQLIYANSQTRGWLVLYTHDVAINPSPYGCTPEYFDEVLRCAVESGADILTIREAVSRYDLGNLATSCA
jgi:peptidoglycan/xylan/chitin deacetylase (PgdA/CDA1 family)